jgi:hypothetical protein
VINLNMENLGMAKFSLGLPAKGEEIKEDEK